MKIRTLLAMLIAAGVLVALAVGSTEASLAIQAPGVVAPKFAAIPQEGLMSMLPAQLLPRSGTTSDAGAFWTRGLIIEPWLGYYPIAVKIDGPAEEGAAVAKHRLVLYGQMKKYDTALVPGIGESEQISQYCTFVNPAEGKDLKEDKIRLCKMQLGAQSIFVWNLDLAHPEKHRLIEGATCSLLWRGYKFRCELPFDEALVKQLGITGRTPAEIAKSWRIALTTTREGMKHNTLMVMLASDLPGGRVVEFSPVISVAPALSVAPDLDGDGVPRNWDICEKDPEIDHEGLPNYEQGPLTTEQIERYCPW